MSKTKPGKLEIPDFCDDVTRLLTRYHDAGCCPGCLAEALFKSAVALVATAGGVCWTKDCPEEIELIDALAKQVIGRLVGAPPGATRH